MTRNFWRIIGFVLGQAESSSNLQHPVSDRKCIVSRERRKKKKAENFSVGMYLSNNSIINGKWRRTSNLKEEEGAVIKTQLQFFWKKSAFFYDTTSLTCESHYLQ